MDNLILNREAAEILGIRPQTLRKWRMKNKGPKSEMIGRDRVYKKDEVEAYARLLVDNG